MTDSINYQYFKTLVEEKYERAHPQKNENTAQTVLGKVWKKMKADFSATDELEEEVRRQANESKILSFTKKSKMTQFSSEAVKKKRSPNYKSRNK